MDGEEGGGYAVSEQEKFKADVKYLCGEIGVGLEHVETIVNVVRLAVLRSPENLEPYPPSPDKRFVFTMRANRNGIQVPALRVLIKIFEEEHRIELLALTSRDVRL
jgi:hypothetical protein